MPITTRLTEALDLSVPIVQGPMGGISGPALVAAVANNGGLGMLPVWATPPHVNTRLVQATQALTDRPFAVNLRADMVQIDHIKAALDAGVSIIHLFWGSPQASMAPITQAGAKMIATVGDSDAAKAALDCGAVALIAQGVEAGGHVLGDTPLDQLLDDILKVSGDVPVIAAGGLADAQDVAYVIAHGASGALLGTRFVATEESDAHDDYKQALLDATHDATVRSMCFDGMWPDAPHRTLRNSTYRAWELASRPTAGNRPGEGDIILETGDMSFPRYYIAAPRYNMTGDLEAAALYAGTGVGKLTDCPPVASLMQDLVSRL